MRHYGLLAVFAAVFLEDFGVPMPGETMLIAAALMASRGSVNIYLLVVTAWCAAVLGDNVGYFIGRLGGRALVLRFGKYVFLTPKRLSYAERFFQKRGALVVVVARFFEILRQLNGVVAGIAGMRWWRFFAYNAVGAALWVSFWSILFFQLGRRGERIVFLLRRYELVPVIVFLLVVGGVLALRAFLRRRRRRSAEEGP